MTARRAADDLSVFLRTTIKRFETQIQQALVHFTLHATALSACSSMLIMEPRSITTNEV